MTIEVTQWEYLPHVQHQILSAIRMNVFGSEGWELVSTTFIPESYKFLYIFKRPKQTK